LRDCGSDRLEVTGGSAASIQAAVLHLHQNRDGAGIILGEDDFLADAKAKVDQMLERAKAKARATPSPKR
jgi:hypothetical protein